VQDLLTFGMACRPMIAVSHYRSIQRMLVKLTVVNKVPAEFSAVFKQIALILNHLKNVLRYVMLGRPTLL